MNYILFVYALGFGTLNQSHIVYSGFLKATKLQAILRLHAFTYSTLKEIKNEIINTDTSYIISNFSDLPSLLQSWNKDFNLLYMSVTMFTIIICLEMYSNSSLRKLKNIKEYGHLQRYFAIMISVFLSIFFRSVENAI